MLIASAVRASLVKVEEVGAQPNQILVDRKGLIFFHDSTSGSISKTERVRLVNELRIRVKGCPGEPEGVDHVGTVGQVFDAKSRVVGNECERCVAEAGHEC